MAIICWYLRLEKKKRVEESGRIRERKERKNLVGFVVVITERRNVLIKKIKRMRKIIVAVIPNHQVLV